ncbi:MAG: Nucleoside ABC transporter, permease protein 1, partial [uncultured Rubrobacteraceae bacterium]
APSAWQPRGVAALPARRHLHLIRHRRGHNAGDRLQPRRGLHRALRGGVRVAGLSGTHSSLRAEDHRRGPFPRGHRLARRHRADASEHDAARLHGPRCGRGVSGGALQHRGRGAVLHGRDGRGLAWRGARVSGTGCDPRGPRGLRPGGLPVGRGPRGLEGVLRGSRGHHDDHAELYSDLPHLLLDTGAARPFGPDSGHGAHRGVGQDPDPGRGPGAGELRDPAGPAGGGRRVPAPVADEDGFRAQGGRALAGGCELRRDRHRPEHHPRARHRRRFRGPRRRGGGYGRLRQHGPAVRAQRGLQRHRGGPVGAQPSCRGRARGDRLRGARLRGAADAVRHAGAAGPDDRAARCDLALRDGDEACRAHPRQARPGSGDRDAPGEGARVV